MKKKILIAADMEGISGVVKWDHVRPGHSEYDRFRRVMTGDVNAAIRGAFEAGANDLVVTDGHAAGNNILLEELDPRARLNSGNDSPFAMVQGIDAGVSGVILVGYHARAGTENAILDHTWSSRCIANLWLNDMLVGETGLNAAICGHFDVPVIMVTGDQSVCAEAVELLGSIETVAVKQASGRMSAECLPPQVAQEKISEAAARAVGGLAPGQGPGDVGPPRPFRIQEPVSVAIEFAHSDMADRAVLMPGVRRVGGRRVEFVVEDMPTAYKAARAAAALA